MRFATTVSSSIFVLTLAAPAFWSDDASATPLPPPPPTCGDLCSSCVYTPARYTSGAEGDVALIKMSSSPTQSQIWLSTIGAGIALQYLHAKLLYDNTGQRFTETFPGGAPPSSYATGEPSWCSRPVSPFYLQRLPGDGAGVYYEDAQVPATLVKAIGRAGCTVPVDSYHIYSFLHDNITGGSCEKLLVDYCGVPVEYNEAGTAGDRSTYNQSDAIKSLTAAWNLGYDNCMQTENSLSGWDAFAQQYIECGGTSQSQFCGRAGWQIVNELLFSAYPLEGTPPAYESGWSDYNVAGAAPPPAAGPYPPPNYNVWSGTMLGGAKTNFQAYGAGENCQTPGDNGPPVACAPWAPTSWTANSPDNIAHAASRLGKTQVAVTNTSGYAAGYDTCTKYYCCE